MKWMQWMRVGVVSAAAFCACALVLAQSGGSNAAGPPSAALSAHPADVPPVPLEWVPPALEQLSAQAAAKTSFTLDRNMLSAAAGVMGNDDEETRQAVSHLDGVSVHVLRFGNPGMVNPGLVDALRDAYHVRGWKRLVTTADTGGSLHNAKTDVWVVMDGVNMRGAVVLVESPKSLTLATVAGNLSPVDLLHLRGHFGIPRFEGGELKDRQ